MAIDHGLNEIETRELLTTNLEYSYAHEDWVFPLTNALEGLTAQQAAWRPTGDALMGVWDIVLHLTAWNDNIMVRIETGQPTHPAEGAWPPRPEELSEGAWRDAQERLWESIARLDAFIQTVPLDQIRSSPWGFGDLVCRFLHLAYHGGQITKIRECQGW